MAYVSGVFLCLCNVCVWVYVLGCTRGVYRYKYIYICVCVCVCMVYSYMKCVWCIVICSVCVYLCMCA